MNSIIFLLLGAALLAALVYSLLKALRRPQQAAPKVDEQTITAIYQNRLQQSQQQFDNGELDQQEYEQAREELSRALAYELENRVQSGAQPAKSGKTAAWTLAIGIPLLAASLYLLLGKPEALQPGAASAQLSIPEMVGRLERRLKSNPEDVQGWRMLGRSYSVLQNFTAASDAYGEAYKREPGNPAITLDYAEAMARANNSNVLGRPAELIEEALQRDPANTRAMILKGVVLYHQENIPAAIGMWKSILANQSADEETRTVVQSLIEQTEALAGGSSPQPKEPSQAKQTPVSVSSVTVELSLAPQFTAQASPNDTVFIFAQAVTGPKVPLAVARKRVADLPLRIVLDDSSAMTQGMNLSSFNQVVVSARVSKSGNAGAASGDLQGKSAVIDPRGNPAINLVIDTKLP